MRAQCTTLGARGVELQCPGVWVLARSQVHLLMETPTPDLSVLSGLTCKFVAVHLTSVQLILQLKLCLYVTVHVLLEEFTNKS